MTLAALTDELLKRPITLELCQTSLEGKVSILTAAGQHGGDAIAAWIDSVQEPVGSRSRPGSVHSKGNPGLP